MSEIEKEKPSRGVRIGRIATLLAILALVGLGLQRWIATRGLESTDDAFVEGTFTYLAAEVQGRVVAVNVEEHERVKVGEVLVRLDDADARARVDRAQADLAAARNRMVSAEAAAAAADADGKAATVESWKLGRELERMESLAKRGAASRQQLDAARAARDAAVARVRAATMRAEAERGVLGNAAPVHQAEAALAEAQLGLDRTTLKAPFDAVVGRKNVDPGDIVRPGQALLSLTRVERRWVEANFKETQIRYMKKDDPATVVVDAFPRMTFYGHVESFSPASGAKYALIPPEPAAGNFTKVVQRVPVRIALDEVEDAKGRRPIGGAEDTPDLAIGLSAVATVDVR